jgi:hypothetical protein
MDPIVASVIRYIHEQRHIDYVENTFSMTCPIRFGSLVGVDPTSLRLDLPFTHYDLESAKYHTIRITSLSVRFYYVRQRTSTLGSTPDMESIEAENPKGLWTPMTEFLAEKLRPTILEKALGNSKVQRTRQMAWWAGNGLHFPFMSLPLELREVIYLYSIGSIVIPRVKMRNVTRTFFLGNGHHSGTDAYKRHRAVEPPNLEILRTNSQISREALTVAWRDTTKRLLTYGRCQKYLTELPHLGLCLSICSTQATAD